MKKSVLFILTMLLASSLWEGGLLYAQSVNKLKVGDISCMKSVSVDMPFFLENTNPNVVALQFEVTVPQDVTINTQSSTAKLELSRTTDHQVRIVSLGSQRYRLMLLSPTNTPFRANKGKLFSLKTSIASTAALEEGATYPVTIDHVVISDSLGHNVMTAYEAGSITLEPCPDFTVSNINVTSSDVWPEGEVALSWTINNIGTRDSQGGWSEQITFVSDNTDETMYLTTMHYTDPLLAGQSVSRNALVAVPRIPGLDGNCHVQIKVLPNSDSGESAEYQTNNTSLSDGSFFMNKKLYMTLNNGNDINEGPDRPASSCLLERSGSRKESMTFGMTKTAGDDRLTTAGVVTIDSHYSSKTFYLTVVDDYLLNPDVVTFTFKAIGAHGYGDVSADVNVINDDWPTLTIDYVPNFVGNLPEGEPLELIIRSTHALTTDADLKLSCNRAERFPDMPTSVTLPAGQTEMTVTIPGYDDDIIDLPEVVTFTVSAPRFHQGQCEVPIADNDMPTFNMTLSKTSVLEDEGRRAIRCTIERSGKLTPKVTIRLSDDGNGELYYSPNVITLKKNQTKAEFYIGVNDDGESQGGGSRDVTFTAAVYVTSCGCTASETSGGMMSSVIHVIDNDGPHFTLRATNGNLLEGSQQNEFILGRNNSAQAVEAHITCSVDGLVTLPASVTIPAGQNQVSFNVAVNDNETSGDTRRVTFTATGDPDSNYGSAKNYGSATCTVIITDQTLPDLTITDVSIDNADNIATGDVLPVDVVVRNSGHADISSFHMRLEHGTLKYEELMELESPLAPDQEQTLHFDIPSMEVAGSYTLKVTADPNNSVVEIDEQNNIFETQVVIKPLFTATANVNKSVYTNTETVYINGIASGLHPYNADIEVYIINGGMRFGVRSKTDAMGQYAVKWKPDGNLAGHFIVGACTVGENLKAEKTSFEMYGMRRYDTGFILSEFEAGETKDGYFDIVNHGSLTLHHITVTAPDMPGNATITIDPVSKLRPGNHARVYFHLTGVTPSEVINEWQTTTLQLTCDEGATFQQKIYFYVYSPKPVLKADITTINTTMTPGKVRDFPITLRNEGRKETGTIIVDVAKLDWLKLATPVKMASLKQGEEATVVLLLAPSSAMPYNSITTGQLAINCDDNVGLTIPFRIETVSEETGTLVIDVWDEFTSNTEEAPHVEGATVSVLHPVTQQLVRQAVTGADGLATFENLNEGNYLVSVTHPKHSSWKQTVMVDPGKSTTQRAFIQYSAITVEMHYEKTEIEDEYDIVTTVTYETNVPKPVVLLEAPDKIILDEIQTPYLFYAHLTNVGLVTAFDATYLIESEVNGYRFTPLLEGPWDILPQQTVSIPVEITKIEESEEEAASRFTGPMFLPKRGHQQSAPRREPGTAIACGIGQMATFFAKCSTGGDGASNIEDQVSRAIQVSSACSSGGPGGPGGPGGAPSGGPSSPGGSNTGGGGGGDTTSSTDGGVTMVACDPYLAENGGDIIPDLAGAACPPLGAALTAAKAANGGGVDAGSLAQKAAGALLKKKVPDLAGLIDKASKLAELAGAMFKARAASPDFSEDDEDCENNAPTASRANRAPSKPYIWVDDEGEEQTGDYEALMGHFNDQVKSLWLSVERGRQRTHLAEEPDELDEPPFFNYYLFDEAKPDLGSIEHPDWFPSAMRAWSDHIVPANYVYYHNLLVLQEVFGDWGFVFFDVDNLQALADSIQSIKNNTAIDLSKKQDREQVIFNLYQSVIPKALRHTVGPKGDYVSASTLMAQRIVNTIRVAGGETLPEGEDNYMDAARVETLMENITKGLLAINRAGYEDESELLDTENKKLLEYLSQPRSSICSSVKLQIEQKMTMTREAVRGTLTVVNGSEYQDMTDVKLNLVVTDPDGNVADSHIMEITTESINGFTGSLDFTTGWTLAPKKTGTAKILFIPTRYAAPDVPVLYTFAGTISFIDPFTGLRLTRDLEVERLTVNPSPVLDLTYFMQRDIFGDDALTPEVEPIVPSQFSLLIHNKGKGDATKVRMLTKQPEVVENEKGLMVNIEIESSQLNGGNKTLALGQSITTDFGNIEAGKSALAQWWMTSSLTGHFTDYDVTATHVTSYDNPDLTLLDQVTIHEMIHQIKLPGVEATSDGSVAPEDIAFLVNDEEDYHDYPDQLYTMDGEKLPVCEANDIRWTKVSDTRYTLRVLPTTNGWTYGSTIDPTGGTQNIAGVRRSSDDVILPAENFWQTDRTLVDKMEPLYENLIHFADNMPATGETYIIDFEPKPVNPLKLTTFSGIPESDAYTRTPVSEVTMAFDRAINESTFTLEDIELTRQGEPIDISELTLVKVNEQAFSIDLSSVTTMDGYYRLTVQMAGITDADGVSGADGRQIGWTQIEDGKATLTMVVEPEGAGTVTPGSSKQDFFGEVALTATPYTGYTFSGWTEDDQLLSTNANYTYTMFGQKTVKAVFTPRQYQQNVDWNPVRGTVKGGGNGMYDYNTVVTLTAEPKDGYYFAGWLVGSMNGELVSTDPVLTYTVQSQKYHFAVFEQVQYVDVFISEDAVDNTSAFADPYGKYFMISSDRQLKSWQWNPICFPFDISEQQINKLWGYATMITRLQSVDDNVLDFGYVYDIKAGVPYLMKPERTVTTPRFEFSGDDIEVATLPITDSYSGFEFVGTYTTHDWDLSRGDGGLEYYYSPSQEKLYKAKSTTASLKGLRAYFVLPSGVSARVNIGGVFTDIEEVVPDARIIRKGDHIYNLQGQDLGTDLKRVPAGVYIVNGHKIVVK